MYTRVCVRAPARLSRQYVRVHLCRFLLLGPEDATTDATWSTADTAMLFMDATTRFPCVQDIMFENDAPTWEQRVTPAQRLSLAIQACEIARAAPGFRLGFFNLKTLRLDVQTHRLYLHDFRGASEQFAVANMTAFNEGYVRMVTPQGDAPRGDPRSFEEHFDTESQFSLGVVIWQLLLGAPAFVRPHPAWNDPRTTIHLSEFVSGALKTGRCIGACFGWGALWRINIYRAVSECTWPPQLLFLCVQAVWSLPGLKSRCCTV